MPLSISSSLHVEHENISVSSLLKYQKLYILKLISIRRISKLDMFKYSMKKFESIS